MKKFGIITTLVIVFALAIFFYFRFYVPFADDGVKDGDLNKIEHKGYLFKTWEGTLIQTGFKSTNGVGVQSPTFEFSVTDENVAKKLQLNSGKRFVLHYKQYYGTLPWRGYSKYVVDSIISMSGSN